MKETLETRNEKLEQDRAKFNGLADSIRFAGYVEFISLEGDGTPKVEASLYSMGSAKAIAIGVITLLFTGSILKHFGREFYISDFELCKAVISFYIEARGIVSQMYCQFSGLEEALRYYKGICRDCCIEYGINYEEVEALIVNADN